MLGLPIAFAAPAVLGALALLAGLIFLLRITPPRPTAAVFPPLRLLLGLDPKETTPAKTPWPILLLRLAVAAAIILAMAGPLWRNVVAGGGDGPLLLLIDDGWPAAPSWERRVAFARETLQAAARAGRLVALAPMSEGGRELTALDGGRAEERLAALAPVPYAPPRAAALPAIAAFLAREPKTEVVWIADGVERGGAADFAAKLAATNPTRVRVALDAASPRAIRGTENAAGALVAGVVRADSRAPQRGEARALDAEGRTIGVAPYDFGAGLAAEARFDLPVELRNGVARLALAGERSAGAEWLVDERSRRRRVALASGATADVAQPLLAPTYYIKRALSPFADVSEWRDASSDPILGLVAEKPSALALADMSVPPGADREALARYVEDGGLLLRFAGDRLAAGDDDLTPTALRHGGRLLGGALSWETPKRIAPFEEGSPFYGLAAPEEVTVSRQVLAEPAPGLAEKTWAHLADGTPLVTAARRGKGLIVLFHMTADTTWSNLPLSGLFVDMLRRVVAEAGAPAERSAPGGSPAKAATAEGAPRPPWRLVDGFGELVAPGPKAEPLPPGFAGVGDAIHPPGFYGQSDAPVAVNAMAPGETLVRANYRPLPVEENALTVTPPLDLRPWLIGGALIGFLVDALLALGLRRAAPARALATLALAATIGALALGVAPRSAGAAEAAIPAGDREAALAARLAYVVTGDRTVDETSRLGLAALTRLLAARTSAELETPVGLAPARDELAFYPLIYWPIVAGAPQPPAAARARVAAFMKNGGTVVFDTRDALNARPGGAPTPEGLWLRGLLAGVDVPALEPAPRDHVLTKTFYLIDRLVGRTAIGETWIEALPPPDPNDRTPRPARAGDSVSPIVIVSDDLAAAWAEDDRGEPLYPLTPGGARQRELAFRSGVNLVMYTLTGNYKADQVHAKDILERLSH